MAEESIGVAGVGWDEAWRLRPRQQHPRLPPAHPAAPDSRWTVVLLESATL